MQSLLSIAAMAFTLTATGTATGASAQTPAVGQPAAPANFTLPHAYQGYAQPEITQCTTTGAVKRECVVPAMTAGRYLIVALASATSTGASATQKLMISLNGQPCVAINPVAFTGKKGLRAACEANFLTDQPLTVTATYGVESATADAGGPQLILRRAPWNGVVDARPVVLPAPKAPPAKK